MSGSLYHGTDWWYLREIGTTTPEIECGSKAMVASYKIQTAAQDRFLSDWSCSGRSLRLRRLLKARSSSGRGSVLSTITQPLVFEGGALTLPLRSTGTRGGGRTPRPGQLPLEGL